MGLTIHYTLASATKRPEGARSLVEKLRDRARDLPFDEVGELVELQGDACDLELVQRESPNRWLLNQARQLLKLQHNGSETWAEATPTHVIAFSVFPADGCEPANFGLCRYPNTVVVNEKKVKSPLSGWRWSSFCKTQYASNPDIGGVQNFVRAHLGVVAILDYAKQLGILGDVTDEGGYFEKRDVSALVKEVHEWNAMIAGAVGALKDTVEAVGGNKRTLASEITRYPNFEHLEAKGRKDDEASQ